MATSRPLSSPSVTPISPVTGLPAPARHRLRAVDPDEVIDVAEFLPPGATWLPAPQHALPSLPGQPPMVGYIVLIPADRPHLAPAAASAAAAVAASAADPGSVPGAPEPDGDPLVRIDAGQRTASVGGRELDLTYLEFELLAHLVTHPNRVHTRDQLVSTVWGYGHVGDGRTVDVHIARLRRKLGAEHRQAIRTVRRVGYKYTPPTGR